MSIKRSFLALLLGLGILLSLLWWLDVGSAPVSMAQEPVCQSARMAGSVITVCLSGGCDYNSVQDAVDAAAHGDVIKVAQGSYTDLHVRAGITQVVYITKSVSIQGGYTTTDWSVSYPLTQPAILNAGGQGRVLYIIGAITPTVKGLHITGGDVRQFGASFWERMGGGVYIDGATAVLSDNYVYSNTAVLGGGVGLYRSSATLNGNIVYSNTASDGGGISLYLSPATLDGNTVTRNSATGSGWGGGVYLSSSNATLDGNFIYDNDSYTGGVWQYRREVPRWSVMPFTATRPQAAVGCIWIIPPPC